MCLARPERFERPTPWFVAKYSIQLSYGRAVRAAHYTEAKVDCKLFRLPPTLSPRSNAQQTRKESPQHTQLLVLEFSRIGLVLHQNVVEQPVLEEVDHVQGDWPPRLD